MEILRQSKGNILGPKTNVGILGRGKERERDSSFLQYSEKEEDHSAFFQTKRRIREKSVKDKETEQKESDNSKLYVLLPKVKWFVVLL